MPKKFTIDQQSVISLNSEVIFQNFDEKGILVNLKNEEIYELNETGCQIAELLGNGKPVSEILDTLSASFEAGSDAIKHDVMTWIRDMADHQLLQLHTPDETNIGTANND